MRLTALLRQAARPRIICVDLDHTLWPWALDKFELKPPYRPKEGNKVTDANGTPMVPFPEAGKCLQYLKDDGYELAAVSRTYYHVGAFALMWYFGWSKYFDYAQIFASPKTDHFQNLQEISNGVPFNQMMLFDDEQRNHDDVGPLGVYCVKVDPSKGLTLSLVEQALKDYAKSAGSQQVRAKAAN